MTPGFTRWEQRLVDTGPAGAAIADAARAARTTVDTVDAITAARRDVTASVLGPVLVAYVSWVLRQAADEDLRRLFFLSRDGQVLLQLARQMQTGLEGGARELDLAYLHASREVWALAALGDTSPQTLAWVLSHSRDASLAGMLDRLGLRPITGSTAVALRQAGLDPGTLRRRLTRGRRRRLLTLLHDGGLSESILQAAQTRRGIVGRHLEQRGVFAGGAALVDIVGRGNQHRAAVVLAGHLGGDPPLGFAVGLQRDPTMPEAVRRLQRAWLYDENSGWGPTHHRALDVLALSVCAADHGTLLGYDEVGDRTTPRLASPDNRPVQEWGLPLVRQTLHALVAALDPLMVPQIGQDRALVAALVRNVEQFWASPTTAEAEALGSFPYETGSGTNARVRPLAPPATITSVIRRSLLRRDRSWAHWDAAAARRGSKGAAAARAALHRVRS